MTKSTKRIERLSAIRFPVLVAGLCVGGMVAAQMSLAVDVGPSDAAPSTQPAPATQPALPIDPAVRALIAKLGDDDPAVRDLATQKLSDLGKAAVPGLREAAEGDDPEARSRAKGLLRHLERHLPPAAPPRNGMVHSQSVSMSVNPGGRTIDVNDNGRKIHIVSRADGQIEMSVTGVEDGKDATETYKAKDAGELKKDNPEAFALYDQWAGENGGVRAMNGAGQFRGGIRLRALPGMPPNVPLQPGGPVPPGGLIGPGGVLVVPGGPPGAGAGVAPLAPQNPQDLQLRLELQQKEIEELQRRLGADAEQRVHDRMRGKTGREENPPAVTDEAKDEKTEKPSKPDDQKPAERPQTRPE